MIYDHSILSVAANQILFLIVPLGLFLVAIGTLAITRAARTIVGLQLFAIVAFGMKVLLFAGFYQTTEFLMKIVTLVGTSIVAAASVGFLIYVGWVQANSAARAFQHRIGISCAVALCVLADAPIAASLIKFFLEGFPSVDLFWWVGVFQWSFLDLLSLDTISNFDLVPYEEVARATGISGHEIWLFNAVISLTLAAIITQLFAVAVKRFLAPATH